jgi:hypothetical protein
VSLLEPNRTWQSSDVIVDVPGSTDPKLVTPALIAGHEVVDNVVALGTVAPIKVTLVAPCDDDEATPAIIASVHNADVRNLNGTRMVSAVEAFNSRERLSRRIQWRWFTSPGET